MRARKSREVIVMLKPNPLLVNILFILAIVNSFIMSFFMVPPIFNPLSIIGLINAYLAYKMKFHKSIKSLIILLILTIISTLSVIIACIIYLNYRIPFWIQMLLLMLSSSGGFIPTIVLGFLATAAIREPQTIIKILIITIIISIPFYLLTIKILNIYKIKQLKQK